MIISDAFYRWAAGGLLLVILATSVFYRARADRLGGKLPAKPDGLPATWKRVAFGVLVWAALLLPILAPEWVRWLTVPLPEWLRLLGLVTLAAAWPWLWWTVATVGNNISPSTSTREGAFLVTSGPYRLVRHPLYTGGFVATLALGLTIQSIPLFIAVFALIWWLPKRAVGEEANLVASYGDQYRAYQAATPRFIPRLVPRR